MKYFLNILKTLLVSTAILMSLTSCEDFLNRPDKGAFTLSDFYQTDEQCLQAANLLYNSPWHDFTRGWLGIGDRQSGNYYSGNNMYWRLALNGSSSELADMAASLWAVNARANNLVENIDLYAGPGTTEAGRNTAKGEALVWKAMAYFFSVRIYGPIPIVHNNSDLLATGEYNSLYRAKIENVYEYIVMTLEKAIEWLPEQNKPGRIDKYTAYGLLAKVYLTRAGVGRSGDRNQDDLNKARDYARLVIRESGRNLEPEYANIFRGSYNFTPEALLSWRWVTTNEWTCANPIQSDVSIQGFDEGGGNWGLYGGPSVDLQMAFGEDALKLNTRQNVDKRRKATMMMYGDVYPNFWRDHPTVDGVSFPNGFDWAKHCTEVLGVFGSASGANCVKHIIGNNADSMDEIGQPLNAQMVTGLATHILRLADVYLVYSEAILGNSASTTDAEALMAFNAVRTRAGLNPMSSITFDDIFKERRLELAFEGDFWYDFVRLSYYKPDDALARLNAQVRKGYVGLAGNKIDLNWGYLLDGVEGKFSEPDDQGRISPRINDEESAGQPYTISQLQAPLLDTDLAMNPNLKEDPRDYDVRSLYTY